MKRVMVLMIIFLVLSSLPRAEKPADYEKYWPQWRGPYATGISPNGNPPLEWNETKNVKWKIGIPGKGHATPVIWGEQIFILTAIETGKEGKPKEKKEEQGREHSWMQPTITNKIHQFVILSINRRNGKVLWQRI